MIVLYHNSRVFWKRDARFVWYNLSAVSYTHLDVYKRQTWDCESYKMANGNTALIPHCTSNPTSMPWAQSVAYFAQDGILYKVICGPTGSWFNAAQEEIWAELKVVLDGFS